jgi:hypothetical protein
MSFQMNPEMLAGFGVGFGGIPGLQQSLYVVASNVYADGVKQVLTQPLQMWGIQIKLHIPPNLSDILPPPPSHLPRF